MQRAAYVKSVLQEKKDIDDGTLAYSLSIAFVRKLYTPMRSMYPSSQSRSLYVTSVCMYAPRADDSRSPECVERVWTEEQDGAWAEGKAPVQLLTALLSHAQDGDVAQAELSAREILELEPKNQLVQDLLAAMKLQEQMEAELESESESESEDEGEGDEEENDSDEIEDDHLEDDNDEEASPQDCEEKNNEEK